MHIFNTGGDLGFLHMTLTLPMVALSAEAGQNAAGSLGFAADCSSARSLQDLQQRDEVSLTAFC